MTTFKEKLIENGLKIIRNKINILQINVGDYCNQVCNHCHVDASPSGKKIMTKKTVDRILQLIKREPQIHTIDITGGATELNENFRYLVSEISALGKQVIDRCNLTVLMEKGQEDTIEFFAKHKVQIFASLPCYTKENVDKQRGDSVFKKSIEVLKKLNKAGYGMEGGELILNLVYNPDGAVLPGVQKKLEADYKAHLKDEFGIFFHNLLVITNMPIKRFSHWLSQQNLLHEYIQLLEDSFNPNALRNIMCMNQISIAWDGKIYDCDFNQALDIPVAGEISDIWKLDNLRDITKNISVDDHCYGCTACNGSSCGGALC